MAHEIISETIEPTTTATKPPNKAKTPKETTTNPPTVYKIPPILAAHSSTSLTRFVAHPATLARHPRLWRPLPKWLALLGG
jgi:hypothetical protein